MLYLIWHSISDYCDILCKSSLTPVHVFHNLNWINRLRVEDLSGENKWYWFGELHIKVCRALKKLKVFVFPALKQSQCEYFSSIFSFRSRRERSQITGLTWGNCGSRADPFQVRSLAFSPEILHFPENLNVSYDVELKEEADGPIQVRKKINHNAKTNSEKELAAQTVFIPLRAWPPTH